MSLRTLHVTVEDLEPGGQGGRTHARFQRPEAVVPGEDAENGLRSVPGQRTTLRQGRERLGARGGALTSCG